MPRPELENRTISSVKSGHLKSVICRQTTSVLTLSDDAPLTDPRPKLPQRTKRAKQPRLAHQPKTAPLRGPHSLKPEPGPNLAMPLAHKGRLKENLTDLLCQLLIVQRPHGPAPPQNLRPAQAGEPWRHKSSSAPSPILHIPAPRHSDGTWKSLVAWLIASTSSTPKGGHRLTSGWPPAKARFAW